MTKAATPQQIEAYRLVYIHGCTHTEAAELMECGRSNVTHLLKTLKKYYSWLFVEKKPKNRRFSFQKHTDSQPIRRF